MSDRTSSKPLPLDSRAIRRRLQREDVLLTAPSVLDGGTVRALLASVVGDDQNVDVVLDLRDVARCDPDAVAALADLAVILGDAGISLTLSYPSAPVDDALQASDRGATLVVRRPRAQRPLRHSMRGQVGEL